MTRPADSVAAARAVAAGWRRARMARGLGPGMGAAGSSGRGARQQGKPRAQPARTAGAAAPLPAAGRRDAHGADRRHRRVAGAAAAGEGGDRQGIERHDTQTLVLVVLAFLRLGAAGVGDDLCADLSRRLGRAARARGPAHPHLHPSAAPADRLLREPARGRADLAHHQRRGGAGKPRHRLGGDARAVRPDAVRGDRGAALSRPGPRAADVRVVPFVAGPRSGFASSRPARSAARARRSARSPPTCRRRCRASAWCAASARSPATRRSSRSSTARTATRTW